jgi:starvation-inducible outer membrane lipoprotein
MTKALLVLGTSALLLAACGTTPPQGQAPSNPSSVSDLVGARGSSFDDEIRRRGFVNKGGSQGGGRAVSIWYNAGTRQCIEAVTTEGRVQAINPIAEGNCR